MTRPFFLEVANETRSTRSFPPIRLTSSALSFDEFLQGQNRFLVGTVDLCLIRVGLSVPRREHYAVS